MKRIFILLFLLPLLSKAQVYQTMPQAGYGPVKRMLFDSVLTLPLGITKLQNITGGRDTGQIRYNKADSSIYIYSGSAWRKVTSGGSSTDTTSLSNRINLKLNEVDTASLSNRIDNKLTSITAISPITVTSGINPIVSTSMSTNKLIGRSTTGTGVMEQINVGSGLTLSAGTLTNTATPTPLGYYGSWQDNITQNATVSNVGYPMIFRTTDLSNGVSVVSNGTNLTQITFSNTGVYNLQFSSQFQNTDNAQHDITIWLRKNGTDVSGSSGLISIPARKSAGAGNEGHIISGWNYVLDIVAGEYYELVWSTSNASNVTMQYYGAGSPPPSAASVIMTVTQQSGIMAGTGVTAINSLTGSAQTMVTGTDSSDFKIVSSGTQHKFNLPDASSTARGVVNTAAQTFVGLKSFNSGIRITGIGSPAIVQIASDGTLSAMTTATYPTPTELSYVKGVTSAIQTQLNGKQATLTNPVTGTATNNEIAYFTSTGSTIGSLTTAIYPSLTELSYVKGVTSSIQSQLNLKLNATDTASLSTRINNRVSLTGNETIAGTKTFSSAPTFNDTWANGQATFGSSGQAGKINFLRGSAASGGTIGMNSAGDNTILAMTGTDRVTVTSQGDNTISTTGTSNAVNINAQGTNGLLKFRTSATQNAQVFQTGNWVFQNGGTFVDNGDRMQVTGNITSTATVKADTISTRALTASGNISAANFTSASGTYSGTVQWTGTAPTTPLYSVYNWTQTGKLVTLFIGISYTNAGATNTSIIMALPSGAPAVSYPTGTLTNETVYMASGMISSAAIITPASLTARIAFLRNTTGGELQVVLGVGSTSAKYASITVQYFTP